MIKLAMFDLDGTLVDSIHDIVVSANHVVTRYGKDPASHEDIKSYIGDGLKTFVKGLAGEKFVDDEVLYKKILEDFDEHYSQQMTKKTVFYPGAEEFMKNFALSHPERKIGVITNKPEEQARIILRHLGYQDDYFVEIFGGDTFDVKKPHPKPLLEMLKKADVAPEHSIMIGDSRQDYEAALAAKTHFVAVSFGYNTREKLVGHGVTDFIDSFSELQTKIDNLS